MKRDEDTVGGGSSALRSWYHPTPARGELWLSALPPLRWSLRLRGSCWRRPSCHCHHRRRSAADLPDPVQFARGEVKVEEINQATKKH